MDLALYDPHLGYYARAARRSGRAGDFFTSVDVGPLFGELIEQQIAEMADILAATSGAPLRAGDVFDLVEAGAGNGRLSADILETAQRRHPELYARTRLNLVERSASARAAQPKTLGEAATRLAACSADLPPSFEGVLLANELFDAMPVHQVVVRRDGLHEIYVEASEDGDRLATREGPLSTPALAEYMARLDVVLEPGWTFEINLHAVEWIREASRRLKRGFMILIDYGHEARELYSASHAGGTLTSTARHVNADAPAATATPPWLRNPGKQDITAHADFTSIRAAAEAEGLSTLGFLDQTYFLLGFADAERMMEQDDVRRRMALKTLVMPGGLGSTMKVLLLGKEVGSPALRGCSYRVRVT
jgi:SAM-dependent MidA family methyltransferase